MFNSFIIFIKDLKVQGSEAQILYVNCIFKAGLYLRLQLLVLRDNNGGCMLTAAEEKMTISYYSQETCWPYKKLFHICFTGCLVRYPSQRFLCSLFSI